MAGGLPDAHISLSVEALNETERQALIAAVAEA